jgi:hypothetical protein
VIVVFLFILFGSGFLTIDFPSALGFMIQRLPTSPGFAGRSSQKPEFFTKTADCERFHAKLWPFQL